VATPKNVLLDPDGSSPDALFIIVEHPTGIVYKLQYGGTATLIGGLEGFLVPVHHEESHRTLREIFERDLRGAGTTGWPDWPPPLLDLLRRAVGQIRYWPSDDGAPGYISLDEGRLAEIDEAWIPVLTADGPGLLIWKNSD